MPLVRRFTSVTRKESTLPAAVRCEVPGKFRMRNTSELSFKPRYDCWAKAAVRPKPKGTQPVVSVTTGSTSSLALPGKRQALNGQPGRIRGGKDGNVENPIPRHCLAVGGGR